MDHLRAHLLPGERAIAEGSRMLVTDRRVLLGWDLHRPPLEREWTHDAIAYSEITRWSEGAEHDGRPMLRLEHPPHVRIERTSAHNVLWFHWGNAARGVTHHETILSFGRKGDPVYRTLVERLVASGIARGDAFTRAIPGTREQRTGGASQGYLTKR